RGAHSPPPEEAAADARAKRGAAGSIPAAPTKTPPSLARRSALWAPGRGSSGCGLDRGPDLRAARREPTPPAAISQQIPLDTSRPKSVVFGTNRRRDEC